MKKIIFLLFLAALVDLGFAQTGLDSLQERTTAAEGSLNALNERVLLNETDLSKLTKIKVSGYIQSQIEFYESDPTKTNPVLNTFFIRRARVKFTYEPTTGVAFVLQPDFSTGNLALKDAYAVVNMPKLKDFSLWMGQFNRPNYEVEYSSTQREVLERSRVIRNIYPGEREIGAKLEYNPAAFPLKLQIAALNGNFTGKDIKDAKDVDSKKDIMARAMYSVNLPGPGIGIDFGAHLYYGGLMAQTKYVSDFNANMDSTDTNTGTYLDKQWFGAEMQVFIDVLGGLSLKGEYIQGKNVFIGDSKANPYKTRNFSGYYAYLIKNIGAKHQLVARYDYYDPNTNLSGDAAGSEIAYQTLNVAWQYYLNDNIRLSLNYEAAKNEINSKVTSEKKDNIFGVRIQAKF